MRGSSLIRLHRRIFLFHCPIILLVMIVGSIPRDALGQPPIPTVAVHVSELTQALETIRATSPTPTGPGTTGYQWWTTAWHYFVMHQSLREALQSDGTSFVEISDAAISVGDLLWGDGTPRYPILISLAAEAVANNEIAPLLNYVSAGGMLFIGSSSFTRNPNGTTRGDFALAKEMGLHTASSSLQNWYRNRRFSKNFNHRLVTHIPSGSLLWRMPLQSEEIPLGVSPSHAVHSGDHYTWRVSASGGATVIATGDSGPLLATRAYGAGTFIYHGAMQPLIGFGGYDSSMYAYFIYRKAVEWAFESFDLPLIKISPWPYDYNAAMTVRHDFENDPSLIRSIESSAAYERSYGAMGDYYFCTGTLRVEIPDENTVVGSLRRAVSNSRATIGSHNGGLRNPRNSNLSISQFDYWHWGPDEALDVTPPGYSSGRAYAQASIGTSFQDIEGWLNGVDNGRTGCGRRDDCPRIWVAPYYNGVREASNSLLQTLAAVSAGEQGISLFPHGTLSTQIDGRRYSQVTLPTSGWYIGSNIVDAIDHGHISSTMRAAADFYYNNGGLVNLYGHIPSRSTTLMGEYVQYASGKSRIWRTNATGISDWWRARSRAMAAPAFGLSGDTYFAQVEIHGATDSGTAVEIWIPRGGYNSLTVTINGQSAGSSNFRIVGNTVKVRVGSSGSGDFVSVSYRYTTDPPPPPPPDETILFTDDFSRTTLPPWTAAMGTWSINSGVLQGTGSANTYTYAYYASSWGDYTVQGRVQMSSGSFGGGIGGRLDPTTGGHYGAWIYPTGSGGGSNVLKLWKFRSWTTVPPGTMQQDSLPAPVGTGYHTLRMTFSGNRIQVYYDGALLIDVTDNNFDSRPPFSSGGISADWWIGSGLTLSVDDISVTSP